MSEDKTIARVLTAEEVWDFPADSRLVAIRWDLLEWGLVLDFDVPESEAKDAKMRRGWLAFDGVSDISFPFDRSRLPTGCFASGGVAERDTNNELHDYVISALFPRFNESNEMEAHPAKDITIRALRVIGILSSASAEAGNNGLPFAVRNKLADDESLLSELVRYSGSA
jgi:hypothetical protein